MKFRTETKEFLADAMRKRISEEKTAFKQQKQKIKDMEDELNSFLREGVDEPMSPIISTETGMAVAVALNTVVKVNRRAASNKKTFKTLVLDCLENGMPMTSRQLMNCVNSKSGRNYEMNPFSGQLSVLVKNQDIVKYEVPENPIATRFFYCLPEWFEGDTLKEYYTDMIHEQVLLNK